jgi:2-polyprenyl-6-methoxyphenol hydroxylase-like FAD-dependent oxidoreductase
MSDFKSINDTEIFDVVLIGYGPVAQVLSLMLARYGWRVAVFERWTKRYPLPRAVCVDHEMFRMLGTLGLRDILSTISHPAPLYRWFNADWQELLCIDWSQEAISGGTEVNFVHQPTLEETLDQAISAEALVTINLGYEAIGITQTSEYAQATVKRLDDGHEHTVRAKFLVGTDGANSITRRSISAAQDDLGFNADWLVIDVLPNEGVDLDIPPAAQWCNPQRPTTIVPAGIRDGRYYRRWEFMRLPGETVASLEESEKAWELLAPWVKPHQAQLVRHKVYSFRSLIGSGWRDGRIMIAGDAAHVMPPFMGQGMCAGFRDDWNLVWKLNLILTGVSSLDLLETYEQERRPHVRDIIELSMFLGKIICIPDPDQAAERDRMFLSGAVAPPAPFPHLRDGILDRSIEGASGRVAGLLSPHGELLQRGKTLWFDEIFGVGFRLITFDKSLSDVLNSRFGTLMTVIGLQIATLSDSSDYAIGGDVDVQGKYKNFLNSHNLVAILVRPDFYMFGGAEHAAEVPALVERLMAQLEAAGMHFQRALEETTSYA